MQLNVIEYLEESAQQYPDKLAFADTNKSLTFSQLANESKQLALEIVSKNESINRPIAVMVDRNVQTLVGFFGIVYSGNYYVPIDNKMPITRILNVLNQVKPKIIIYSKENEDLIKEINTTYSFDAICSDIDIPKTITSDDEALLKNRFSRILDIDPVYVIFTSGSTGNPKGIVISHRSVIDFTDWMTNTFGFTNEDIMANQAPFYFDLSVKDIYTTIKNGASTYIIPKKHLMFPFTLIDFLNDKKVTSLIWATSAFNLVSNSKVFEKKSLSTVNKVILGGEALLAKHLNTWKKTNPNIKYINLYGPTEVTVDCTYYIIDRDFKDEEIIPIGKACENKEVIILNEDGKCSGPNEIGEICVRGTGLAKGYFGDFEKTEKVFIQNPLIKEYPDIIYKTGDIGYKNEEGVIFFSSRKDGQIKHQGYRIELGEIERAINSFEKINASICFYDGEKDKIVCAYNGDCSEDEIIVHISKLIPKYMYPNYFIALKKMPYNANGKIDRVKIKGDYFDAKD